MKTCDGVFEGGGVRGIGHVGAACGLFEAGYRFVDLAGSSAGAIVAALLAAGYGCGELKREMEGLDYRRLRGRDWLDSFGVAGKTVSLLCTLGIYNTEYLEQWVGGLLKRKGMETFGDVKKSGRRLKITASDLTKERLLIFPDDLPEFGVNPDSFPISAAVRMSVSIPVFFEPVRWRDGFGEKHLMVDGGLLSNYPMWVLDDGERALERPVFGFKFQDERKKPCPSSCPASLSLADYLKSIVTTCLDAFDNGHLTAGDFERTVRISPGIRGDSGLKRISAVDFDISREESRRLFENGREAARLFLRSWDFEEWKRRYRS